MNRSRMLQGILSQQIFTPLELFSNNEQGIWLDASDTSTMFQDSAGTTPVTTDGDPVGLIQDKSGNGNNAFQSTLSKRPTYKTDGAHHWLYFNGGQSLITNSIDFTLYQAITNFYGVYKGINEGRIIMEMSANYNNNEGTFINFISSGGFSTGTNATGTRGATAETGTALIDAVGTSIHSPTEDLTQITINRTYSGFNNDLHGDINFSNHPLYIGSRNDSSVFFVGKMYQLITASGRKSDEEITQTEDYIADKIGITL